LESSLRCPQLLRGHHALNDRRFRPRSRRLVQSARRRKLVAPDPPTATASMKRLAPPDGPFPMANARQFWASGVLIIHARHGSRPPLQTFGQAHQRFIPSLLLWVTIRRWVPTILLPDSPIRPQAPSLDRRHRQLRRCLSPGVLGPTADSEQRRRLPAPARPLKSPYAFNRRLMALNRESSPSLVTTQPATSTVAVSGDVPWGKPAVTGFTYFGEVDCGIAQKTVSLCNVGDCPLSAADAATSNSSTTRSRQQSVRAVAWE